MNFSKISELKPYDLNCNIFDVYSYDGLSMQELLCQFFTKINECIKVSNDTIDLTSWLVNEGLKKEVVEKLVLWLSDGTLTNIINETVFNDLSNKINNLQNSISFEECINLLGISDLSIDEQIEQCVTYSRRNLTTLTFKSNKTYEISKPIKITNFSNDGTSGKSQNIDFNNCIIKAMTEMQHMILVNTSSNPFGSIKNVTLDANKLALDGIRVAYTVDFRFDDIYIKNFKRYGIRIAHTDSEKGCGSAFYNNLYIKNEIGVPTNYQTIGIYTDGADSHFSNIKIRNTNIGVFNNNGVNFYDKVHGYMTDTELIPTSIFMQIENGGARLNQCYADTYYISYQINSLKAKVYLNGCYNFWLDTYYPKSFNKPIIFNFKKEQSNVGEEIIVNGMYVSNPATFENVLFCNLENLSNWSDSNINMEDNNQLASCINYPNGKIYGELTLLESQKDKWDIHYNELLKDGKTVYCRVRMSLKSGITLTSDSQFNVFSFPAGFRPLYNKPFVTHSILSTTSGANSYILPTFIENSSSTNTLKIRTPVSPNSNSNNLYIYFNYKCI